MTSRPARVRHGLAHLLSIGLLLMASFDVDAKRFSLRFTIDGMERKVLVYAPDQIAAEPPPLIIVYHGRGDDSGKFANAVKLHKDWPEAIVAYPRGETIDTTPPMRGWQSRLGQYQDRDLQLTDRLLKALGKRYAIQRQTTYAAGFSNGGHFVFLLAAERAAQFSAFAVIGSVHPNFAAESTPRPFLYLFGRGEDRQYQDDWGKTVQALMRHNQTIDQVREYSSCCQILAPRAGGAPLVFGLYNAGHIWPSEGNRWLIEFLKKERLETAPTTAR